MSNTISVIEYERVGKDDLGCESNYKQLKELCLQEHYKDVLNCYNGKICFNKYAGIIQLKNGTFVEVLPKICLEKEQAAESRAIFTKMIATLKSNYYKSFADTHISSADFPLLEVFITIFLDEVDKLIRLGLRKNYIKVIENSTFIKGKIKIAENIQYNHSHREKNYVEYNQFIENTPENIVIKTCICYLKNKSKNFNNIKRLNQALFVFDNVLESYAPEQEFKKIHITRLNKYYEAPLELAKVFLLGDSFLPQKGNSRLLSLMFPLEKLFEDYVFYNIKKQYKTLFKSIKAQTNPYCLIESENKFRLKPDIVMETDDKILILDTKWKLLDSSSSNDKYNVSQSDLYQLYAYGKKYQKKTQKNVELFLVYPLTEKFYDCKIWNYEDDFTLPINIVPYDLKNNTLIYDKAI